MACAIRRGSGSLRHGLHDRPPPRRRLLSGGRGLPVAKDFVTALVEIFLWLVHGTHLLQERDLNESDHTGELRLPSEFAVPGGPNIDKYAFPDADRLYCDTLSHNLSAMRRACEKFVACMALLNSYHPNRIKSKLANEWANIACEQAIVAAFNYSEAGKAIRKNRDASQYIRALCRNSDLENAISEARIIFPNIKELRQTVMHNGELYSSISKVNQNVSRKGIVRPGFEFGVGGELILYGGSINGYEYMAQFAGAFYTIEVSPMNSLRLIENIKLIFQSFAELPNC